ncbi:MAG: XisI protein [Symploca sp. SIO2G7]|nr:XisI protein [Symploca sp. SIO2G7]
MHFDIKDGKIWIQENVTEAELGQDLVNMGVAREDIVLGFQVPYA